MTLAGRLKLSVAISSLFLLVLMGILSYLMYIDVQGYKYSYRYQVLQETLSQLSGEFWQLHQYNDLQSLDRAIELSLNFERQLQEIQQLQGTRIGHVANANNNLRVLIALYPKKEPSDNTNSFELLTARINTIILSMQDEVAELRHLLVEKQHYAKRLILVSIALLLFLSMTAVILFNLHTLTLFRRGVSNLTSGIHQMAQGDLSSELPEEEANPEFKSLSQHFNRMKKELKYSTISRADLQHEVDKRTQALEMQKQHFQYQAEHDPLTQVYTRKAFFRSLENNLHRLTQTKGTGALLFIDVNNFKSINDTYGHGIGDHVLITVAKRIEQTLRQTDMVSRLGGDEFVVWLEPIGSRQQLDVVITKLLDTLRQDIGFQNIHLLIDVSIGVAFFPDNGSEIEALLTEADKNMYSCKQNATKGYVSSS
ncbi:diguanylate cyclase domain-containing protein [Shewanella sp.]|uniref:diguanylate cyclase domain-containing protein n=1 Tax=Shewanella sp. TaxID=50422 RepID=UPI00356B5DCE